MRDYWLWPNLITCNFPLPTGSGRPVVPAVEGYVPPGPAARQLGPHHCPVPSTQAGRLRQRPAGRRGRDSRAS